MREMGSQVAEKFSDYYEEWMLRLEDLVKMLLVASREHRHEKGYEATLNKFTLHHKEYYQVKWALAHEDVLPFFAPVWLSPLENAYLWITGWKPSISFRLIDSLRNARPPAGVSLSGMTEEQVRRVEALKEKIRVEEEKVEREMERQQVSIADRKMVELMKVEKQVKRNGGGSKAAAAERLEEMVEGAVKGLMGGLERVVKMADCVRLKTLKGVLEVLTPMQGVDFLAATSMLQIQTRKWGKKKQQLFANKP